MRTRRFAAALAAAAAAMLVPAAADGSIKTYDVGGAPGDMVRAADGSMWFAKTGAVGRITTAGATRTFALPASATANTKDVLGLATAPDGSIWAAEGGGTLARIDGAGKVTEFAPAKLGMLAGVAVAPDGQVWASDAVVGRLLRLDLTATLQELALGSVPGADFRSDPPAPTDMVVGPDGAVWFLQHVAGRVGRVGADGIPSFFPLPAGPLSYPTGVAVGPDGALWIAEAGVNRIARMTTGGSVQEFPIPSSVAEPRAIAVGPDGAMWFSEPGRDRLGRIDGAGKVTEYGLPAGSAPYGVVAGADGAVWATLSGTSKVARVTADIAPVAKAAARRRATKRVKHAKRHHKAKPRAGRR